MSSTEIVDVIIPVFNEADGLERFYRRISALSCQLNLIFIDNASTDSSVEIIRSFPNASLIQHDTNEGYGGSLIDGIEHALAEKIIVIDADCEYPPECIPELIEKLDQHSVVYASRFLNKSSASDANMPRLKMLGNKIISGSYNILFKQNCTDLYTGCKGFKRSAVNDMNFHYKGFEHVLELACKLATRGHKINDIAITFEHRQSGSSKMSHLAETTKFFVLLIWFYLSGLRSS